MSSLFSFEIFVEHNHVFTFLRCVNHIVLLLLLLQSKLEKMEEHREISVNKLQLTFEARIHDHSNESLL